MTDNLKKKIPDSVKKAAVNIENVIKAPYRKIRTQVLRKQIPLNIDSADFAAHRGLSAVAPENTLPAFRLAAAAGFRSIETDIRRTRDRRLVLMHDASLKRMCGRDVKVRELSYEELSAIPVTGGNRAGLTPSDADDLYVPLLSQFLEICRDNDMVPMLELKDKWNEEEPLSGEYLNDVIGEVIEVMGQKPVIFVSFNLKSLIRLKKMLEDRKINHVTLFHLVLKIDQSMIPVYKKRGIHLSVKGQNNRLSVIRKVKKAGIKTVVWVVDNPDQARLYIKTKVDWIASNGKVWEASA